MWKKLHHQGSEWRGGGTHFCRFQAGEIDAILMDVMMPVMDGLEATRRIRAMKRPDARTIPIIAMTANAFAEDRQLAFAAGMDMHIAKPLEARRWWKRWSGLSNPRENRSRSARRMIYKGKSAENG